MMFSNSVELMEAMFCSFRAISSQSFCDTFTPKPR